MNLSGHGKQRLQVMSIDKARSRWFKIRAYPNNVEIQVEATYSGGRFGYSSYGGASPVAAPRALRQRPSFSGSRPKTRKKCQQ